MTPREKVILHLAKNDGLIDHNGKVECGLDACAPCMEEGIKEYCNEVCGNTAEPKFSIDEVQETIEEHPEEFI